MNLNTLKRAYACTWLTILHVTQVPRVGALEHHPDLGNAQIAARQDVLQLRLHFRRHRNGRVEDVFDFFETRTHGQSSGKSSCSLAPKIRLGRRSNLPGFVMTSPCEDRRISFMSVDSTLAASLEG